MRMIISIDHVEKKVARKDGRKYVISYATLDDGQDEVEGFGLDFKPGDQVEVFFHYGRTKMRKPDWDGVSDPLPEQD